MADKEFNPWEFGSGLREEYDFTVHMSYFGTDARYGNGEVYLLILSGEDEEGEDVTEMYSVGSGFESLDGGKTIVYPDKPNHKLNRNSIYARFCGFAMEACEKVDSKYLIGKSPFSADSWIGTRWHMLEKQSSNTFVNRQTGDKVEARMRLMPDEFLGLVEEGEAAIPKTAKAGATKKPAIPTQKPAAASAASKRAELLAKARGATEASENGAGDVRGQLAELAVASDTFDAFIEQALGLEDVLADDALAGEVVDSSSDGFYSLHHG